MQSLSHITHGEFPGSRQTFVLNNVILNRSWSIEVQVVQVIQVVQIVQVVQVVQIVQAVQVAK